MEFYKDQNIYGVPVLEDNIIWFWIEKQSVAIIDPGISKPIIEWMHSKNLILDTIFQTHHHYDHIGGTEELLKEWPNAKVIASKKDKKRIPFQNISVEDGEKIIVLNKEFTVIELIGHTKTHLSFFSKDFQQPILFVGDTLFSGGCGRIFKSTHEQMYKSLKRITYLPKNTLIYSAHEYTRSNLLWALDLYPKDERIRKKLLEVEKKIALKELTLPTTLKDEMDINLFLRAKTFNEFSQLRAKKDSWV